MAIPVSAVARRKQYTVGSSGQQGPYAFTFNILADADLAIYVNSTLKTITTHYLVTTASDGTGSITFVAGQYPSEDDTVTLIGAKAIARTSDFTAGGDIKASTFNTELDTITIVQQQLEEIDDRSLQLDIHTTRDVSGATGPLVWPYGTTAANASKVVAYTAAGNALELTDKAVSSASASASNVAVTSAGAAGTATASVSLSGAGALAFALGIPVGSTGMAGGVSMQYSTTTADADPGVGFVRFNNTSLNSATIMYVDDSDGTTDISAWVQSWDDSNSPNRGFITIAGNPNPSSPLTIFKVNNEVTDASGYTKIPVAYVAGSTSISNAAEISVQFSPSGDGDYAGLDYVFSTTTTDSDPGAGTLRLNHGTLGSVTAIYIDDADANTANVESYLLSWDDSTNLSNRGLVRITKKTAPANYAVYRISGASTDASGYVKLAVAHSDSNGSISDSDTISVEFASSGNIGIPAGLNLTYSTTTTDSDPGSGVIRFNNATLSSATAAYIDDADSAGANIEAYVLSWDDSTNTALRGTITLTERDNPAIFAIWNLTSGSTDASGYSKLALTYVTGTGSFSNNDAVVLTFARTGNAGSDASDVFKTISVAGQDNIVADSATDTLTLAAGSNITITTTAATDTITIAGAAGGASLSGSTNNTVATVTGANALIGEANLQFDGSTLTVTGDVVPGSDSAHDLGTSSAAWAEVYMDHCFVGGGKLGNVTMDINNVSGTMKHRMGGGGSANADSVYVDFINANNQNMQVTPTGTDSSTAMAYGAKISTSYTAGMFLDVVDQSKATANHQANCSGNNTAFSLVIQCYIVSHDINGTTLSRHWFYLVDNANQGASVPINTTNVAAGDYITIDLLGFFKV